MIDKKEERSDNELYDLLRTDKETAEKAFAELYARHSGRVYAYCRRFLGNKEDALDVFQETFIRFYQTAVNERSMTNVPAFMLKIARNLCVNFKRREKHTVPFNEFDNLVNSTRQRESDELLELVKMAMEILPPEYKDIFILREYEGFSYSEIAEIAELPLSTVKIRIFRAKQKIREILAPYLADLSK